MQPGDADHAPANLRASTVNFTGSATGRCKTSKQLSRKAWTHLHHAKNAIQMESLTLLLDEHFLMLCSRTSQSGPGRDGGAAGRTVSVRHISAPQDHLHF